MVLYIVHVVVLLCTEFLRTVYRENKILYKLVFDKISVLYCNMALSMTFFQRKSNNILSKAKVCEFISKRKVCKVNNRSVKMPKTEKYIDTHMTEINFLIKTVFETIFFMYVQ
ncbi:hypothetical protein KUTeg_002586 [Tegillarca granosa]|uniref:Uncharacterized protein n=1 Tax=Tegillarca granosa TaxID=220873 RepID=A0ABQ9FUV0_TEGGR|nr:hypothetical protein KUTeg_002586 [Tegillarca granosa]